MDDRGLLRGERTYQPSSPPVARAIAAPQRHRVPRPGATELNESAASHGGKAARMADNTAAADWYRRSGSFSRQRSTTRTTTGARSGRKAVTALGESCRMP